MKALERGHLKDAFDGTILSSRPTKQQQTILDDISTIPIRYVLGGNRSGKSQLGAKEIALLFCNEHPTFEYPPEWKKEPLQMLMFGKTTTQLEHSLWRKIEQLIPKDCWKPFKQGGALKTVTHKENGNMIIFISHNNTSEARENAQSYTAHYAWFDEMPKSATLLEEVVRRVIDNNGRFLMTMTPKVVNQAVRKVVDAAQLPYAHKYKLRMFDNPVYHDEKKREIALASLEGHSETYKRTVLEGDWMLGEEMVYYYDAGEMNRELPPNYSTGWRHVLSVDPALKSKLGMCLLAENPADGTWFVAKAEYLKDVFRPSEMVKAVEERVAGYNIFRRVCDTEPWFYGEANGMGITYWPIREKANRKGELMKNVQTALGKRVFLTPECGDLEEELTSCRWSDTSAERIVNSSTYHIIDSLQYAVDNLPKWDPNYAPMNWMTHLHVQDEKRQMAEARKKTRKRYRMTRKGRGWL